MDEQLISVIVPVYKVEPYLDQCVASIVNQTYQDLEIILVDDGSPDNCPAMCDTWAKRDCRIKVIHKENGGLSDARNAGLKIASGAYIALIDSDDIMDVNMLTQLYQALEENNADIAECDYVKFENGQPDFSDGSVSITVLNSEDALRELLLERIFRYTAWNKLYRKEVFSQLQFEVGKLHEDVFFTYQAFGVANRIVKLDAALYGYRQRSGSIMGSAFSLRNLDSLEARYRQLLYIREHFPSLEGLAQGQLLGNCRYFGQLALRSENPQIRIQAMKYIEPLFRKEAKNLCFKPSGKEQLWLMLAKISFWGCCRIRNTLKIGL